MSNKPTDVTPFARTLGITEIGALDKGAKTYIVTATPTQAVTNFFRTAHGGFLQGALDDSAGMLIFLLYGTNSAITSVSACVEMLQAPRLNQPLIFTVRITSEDDVSIAVAGEVHNSAGKLVARTTSDSRWCRRHRRRRD